MKKGFTLVELIAVIILLASMSLVTFLSLNNMIKKTQINNDKSLISTIVDEATILYNDYVFSDKQDQIISKDIYNLMTTKDKPKQGSLYINGLGQISIAVIYNGRCYTKDFGENNISYTNNNGECAVKYLDSIFGEE